MTGIKDGDREEAYRLLVAARERRLIKDGKCPAIVRGERDPRARVLLKLWDEHLIDRASHLDGVCRIFPGGEALLAELDLCDVCGDSPVGYADEWRRVCSVCAEAGAQAQWERAQYGGDAA